MSIFSERLKWLRERKGFTQKYMAEKLDILQTSYSKYEYGQREPNIETLKKIPGILGESIDFMLGITNFTKRIEPYHAEFQAKVETYLKNKDSLEQAMMEPETVKLNKYDDIKSVDDYIRWRKGRAKYLSDTLEKAAKFIVINLREIPGVDQEVIDYYDFWNIDELEIDRSKVRVGVIEYILPGETPYDDLIRANAMFVTVDADLVNGHPATAFRVNDDAMSLDNIFAGDIVVVVNSKDEKPSDMLLLRYGKDFYVRRLSKQDGMFILSPSNPEFPPMIKKKDDEEKLFTLGKVIKVIKN